MGRGGRHRGRYQECYSQEGMRRGQVQAATMRKVHYNWKQLPFLDFVLIASNSLQAHCPPLQSVDSLRFLVFLILLEMVNCACGRTFRDDATLGRHRHNCQAARKRSLELFERREEVAKRKKMASVDPSQVEQVQVSI